MICYANNSLSEYLACLAAREPVPGGGSAAAVSAAMGVALLEMSIGYSLGKGKTRAIEGRFEKLMAEAGKVREALTAMASQDARAYLNVVAARKSGDETRLKEANREAAGVPRELVKICRKWLGAVPFLKKEANRYLVSDVIAAEVFLNAAINAAQAMVEANQ